MPSSPAISARGAGRRRLVGAVTALLSVLAALLVVAGPRASADPTGNPIVVENAQPGTDDWRINGTPSDDVTKQIKGYASATSVNVGSSITFYVTVNPVQKYSIDVFRIGYYQGLGGRLMRHVGGIDGVAQPDCVSTASTGMVSCDNWSPSYDLDVPTTWTSGIYLAKLTNASGFQNYIVFTVRDDARPADLLYQQSVTTYQAYNNYPNDVPAGGGAPATGRSLYDYNSRTTPTGLGTTRAVKVSFDRPYSNDDGAGDFLDWELYQVRWLEENGYDVAYSTDVDTHAHPERLLSYHAFLSVGHDEYWSKSMRDGVEAARDSGVNLAFLGANAAYWQVRFESSAGGTANRVLVCYKSAVLDPVSDSTVTVKWRDSQVNRPEQSLMGVMSTGQQPNGDPPAPHVVRNSTNWVYDGVAVHDGDAVPGIVGYETDRVVSNVPSPVTVPGTYTLLSTSPYSTGSGTSDYANASVYKAPSGAWVFAAGSIEWAWGLYNYGARHYADPRIQRMTANVLDRFALGGTVPAPAAPSAVSASPSPGSVSLSWQDNAANETSYEVDRSTTPTFDQVHTTTLPADSTGYNDTGLAAGVYYYRVRAANATDNSGWSGTAAVATTSYQQLVGDRGGLVARWRLGDASGTTAADSAGTYAGTYQNGVTLGAAGAITRDPDTAAAFNGTNNKVSLPALPATTDFTIEGWTYLTSGSVANDTLYGSNGNVRILARPGGQSSATIGYAGVWLGGTEYVLQPGTNSQSNLNAWVQWALTRSGNTLTLYRNGVQIGQRTDLPAATPANISGWLGAQTGNAFYLQGRIDDVTVYDKALTGGAVVDGYTAATNGLAPAPPPVPPTAPSAVSASPTSASSVSLSWQDNATNETSYRLDRSTTATFDQVQTTTLPADSTGYTDTGLPAGVYYYRVRAGNATDTSGWSGTAGVATTSYQQLVQGRSGLIARWRLGEATGTAAVDGAGSYTGTYQNGVSLGAAGAITRDPDTAASFNGTNNKVSLPDLPATTDFTIEGWTYLTSASVANDTLYGSNGNVRILARPGGQASGTIGYAGLWLGGTEYVLQPGTNSQSNLNTWVHWALTRAGSTLTLYRNGVQLAQRSDLPAATPANISGWLGAQTGNAFYLQGRIDDVAVYNKALTGAAITDGYTAATNGLAPPPPAAAPSYRSVVLGEPGLLSYWRLGEASGPTATDAKGTANGTYVNGVGLGAPGAIANDQNTAASFNGTSNKVSLPAVPPTTDFSVEGWTYLTNGSSNNNALYGANGSIRILVRPGGASTPTLAYAGVWVNGTEYTLQPSSGSTSNLNTWVHWVVTRSGSTLRMFRNGIQVAQRSDLPAGGSADISGWIGAQGGNAYYLAGRIDDVAVYTAALTPARVAAHYDAALNGPAPQ